MAKTTSTGFSPLVRVSDDTAIAKHEQIAQELRVAMELGYLSTGTRLASTRVLANDWGVSRNTVMQVFASLSAEGYIASRTGDGTYVIWRNHGVTQAPSQAADTAEKYPFRRLSRRGRALVAEPEFGLPDRPLPFMPNVPDFRLFPMSSWLRLMNEVSGRLTGQALVGVSTAGYLPLRQAIVHHVSVARGRICDAEQIIITTGSQQAHDLAVRLLCDRGDPVWMEEPGYLGIKGVLSANGCNIQNVPVDGDGIDVEFGIANLLSPRLICVTPARQFPTGATLSAERRAGLLDFAASCGAWIIEDDFDAEFHFSKQAPHSLGARNSGDRVVLIGTFSTTLVPSLRLGYIIVPPDLILPFTVARAISQGYASLLEQMVLAEMMNRGIYVAHTRRMRKLYRARQDALADELASHLGYRPPERERASGMHIVLPLIDAADDRKITSQLAAQGVLTRALSPHYALKTKSKGLLLGFAAFSESQLAAASLYLAPLDGLVARD